MPIVEERIAIRDRKQITIPKTIADARNLHQGQPLIVHIDDDRPNEIVLRILPDSYAGALTNVFANVNVEEYVDHERATWA